MLALEEALSRIFATMRPLEAELIPLSDAHQRFCAEDIFATMDLPAFDNSAMDGYAVRAEDLATASVEAPVELRQIGSLAAGEMCSDEVLPGSCIRVFTGSVLPYGSDAVVMQEDTVSKAGSPLIQISEQVKPWENVRFQGEDVRGGSKLIGTGHHLTVGRISLLAAQGMAEIRVARRPVVGLIATGNELCEPGQPLPPGHIYESNRTGLAALIRKAGGLPQIYPLVRDTMSETRTVLEAAFADCDMVVSSGGVSVGEFDFIKMAFQEIGGELDFWKVAIRPGKPFVFGRREHKLFFGVPGNPASALVTFHLLVRPALLRWQGAGEIEARTSHGVLAESFVNPTERRHFMRVRVDRDGRIWSAGSQVSHSLGSLAQSNGLIDVPPRTTLEEGKLVRVMDLE